jgi:hypothetical protein
MPRPLAAARTPWRRRMLRVDPYRQSRVRKGFVIALAASIALHLALSLLRIEPPTELDTQPLQATITELPPPPAPVAVAAAKPKAKARRATNPLPPPVATPEPESAPPAHDEPPALIDPTPEAIATGPELPAVPVDVAAATPAPIAAEHSPDTLPPRVDLVYKGFLGTQGFQIGDAVYRFEHAGSAYRIFTVGKLSGLLALFFPGEAKIESHGVITSAGLQPLEFSFERTSRHRREIAQFDWEAGVVTLQDQNTAALESPTFDALSIMWQYYFTPPRTDEVTFSLATTRRLKRYTVTRDGEERIKWGEGEIDTERWHHRSEDGRVEGYAWLAPSLHYIPVKMRYIGPRVTFEALLDSIRVDETLAQR